jgi:hypothetical protein
MNGKPVNAASLPAFTSTRWASAPSKSPPTASPHLTAVAQAVPFHKAASFSTARRPTPSPCSTPVPIPRKARGDRQRRWSASDSLFAPEDALLSKTQCEAQLWDDDWHFKLSLEARESFEAAAGESSAAPTDASSELGSLEDALFEMDDL